MNGDKSFLKRSIFVLMVSFLMCIATGYSGIGIFDVYADKQYVYDDADIFTDDDADELSSMCEEYSEKNEIDFVITTVDETHGKSAMTYANDFMEAHYLGYESDGRSEKSCVMLLLDFDNNDVWIDTTGIAILCIEDDDIEDILDDIFVYIPQKDYYSACKAFIKSTDTVIRDNKKEYAGKYIEDWKNYSGDYADFYNEYVNVTHNFFYHFKNPFISLLAAALTGGIAVGIMAAQNRSKMTANRFTYMDKNNMRIHVANDIYTNTTTRRYKQSSSSGGGGGRGGSFHSSGGGHSHGGGGRHM